MTRDEALAQVRPLIAALRPQIVGTRVELDQTDEAFKVLDLLEPDDPTD